MRTHTGYKTVIDIKIVKGDSVYVTPIITAIENAVLDEFLNVGQIHRSLGNAALTGNENLLGVVKLIDDTYSVIDRAEFRGKSIEFMLDGGLHQLLEDVGAPRTSFICELTIAVVSGIDAKGRTKYAELRSNIHDGSPKLIQRYQEHIDGDI
jgi:hypothetical protein